jgi:hypothetical protein
MEGGKFYFFYSAKSSTASSTREKKEKKRARKRKRKSFETGLVSLSQLLCCWFSSNLGAIGWFSTTQAPSNKLPPALTTPAKQQQ